MLDQIQSVFNRINAAAVQLQAGGNETALRAILDDLEAIADDAENPGPTEDPTPPADPV